MLLYWIVIQIIKIILFECLCSAERGVKTFTGGPAGKESQDPPPKGRLGALLTVALAAVVDGLVAAVLEHVLLHLLRGQAVPVLDFRCVMIDLEVVVYLAAGLRPPGVQTAQVVRTSRVMRATALKGRPTCRVNFH